MNTSIYSFSWTLALQMWLCARQCKNVVWFSKTVTRLFTFWVEYGPGIIVNIVVQCPLSTSLSFQHFIVNWFFFVLLYSFFLEGEVTFCHSVPLEKSFFGKVSRLWRIDIIWSPSIISWRRSIWNRASILFSSCIASYIATYGLSA